MKLVYKLIQEKFTDYLNLLYIIDVPEKQVKALDGEDIVKLSEDVSFLILSANGKKYGIEINTNKLIRINLS